MVCKPPAPPTPSPPPQQHFSQLRTRSDSAVARTQRVYNAAVEDEEDSDESGEGLEDQIDMPEHQKTFTPAKLDTAQFTKSDFGGASEAQREAAFEKKWMRYRVADPRILKLP